MNNITLDTWSLKFKKEGWTFAFGSMMQAYSQIASPNKLLTFEQFKSDAYELYKLSKQMCAESVEEDLIEKQKVAENPDDVDIPV
jgi:hypothetical protein